MQSRVGVRSSRFVILVTAFVLGASWYLVPAALIHAKVIMLTVFVQVPFVVILFAFGILVANPLTAKVPLFGALAFGLALGYSLWPGLGPSLWGSLVDITMAIAFGGFILGAGLLTGNFLRRSL